MTYTHVEYTSSLFYNSQVIYQTLNVSKLASSTTEFFHAKGVSV